MSTKDHRKFAAQSPIATYAFEELSWASGETAGKTAVIENVSMLVERLDVVASNSTNAITWTVAIAGRNSAAILSIASIPENATTTKLATKATPDFPACPVNENLTVTVTPSGDPGASGATVTVSIDGP